MEAEKFVQIAEKRCGVGGDMLTCTDMYARSQRKGHGEIGDMPRIATEGADRTSRIRRSRRAVLWLSVFLLWKLYFSEARHLQPGSRISMPLCAGHVQYLDEVRPAALPPLHCSNVDRQQDRAAELY